MKTKSDYPQSYVMKIGPLNLLQPIILAPMEDVTDLAFRLICKRHGADVVYTEFISSEGLIRDVRAAVAKLQILDEERPIGIQIYGNRVDSMVAAAKLAALAKPDILDINYGCPTKSVAGKGAGSGLLCNPDLMAEMTRAVVAAVDIPVTAKTRIGWNEDLINIVEIAQMLEDCGIQALTIHGRTRSQGFKGQADWQWIAKAKQAVRIPIVGNGDVCTPEDVQQMFQTTGCDGVMIGRGTYGNPWIFQQAKHYLATQMLMPDPPIEARIEVLLEHLALSIHYKGLRRGIIEMGKHYGNYLKGMPNTKHLKAELRFMMSYQDIRERLQRFIGETYQWQETRHGVS